MNGESEVGGRQHQVVDAVVKRMSVSGTEPQEVQELGCSVQVEAVWMPAVVVEPRGAGTL